MGKASRWMINFFLGKKERNARRKISLSMQRKIQQTATVPSNPTIKRTIVDPRVIKTIVPQTRAANRIRKAVEDAAATRIQAVFRSYLICISIAPFFRPGKLCVLMGLVKLQVLVPGEETNCCYTSANACTYDNTSNNSLSKSSDGQGITNFRQKQIIKTEIRGISSRSGYINHPLIDRIEREVPRFYSGELQISRQEHQYKEFCFTSQNSPSIFSPPSRTPGRASFTYETPDYADTLSNQFSFLPNYMADTESSKAKFRSQSESKQQPKQGIRVQNKQTFYGWIACPPRCSVTMFIFALKTHGSRKPRPMVYKTLSTNKVKR
ncbi:hypothetical protein NC652_013035 [Populus alba x Populus x berolinensis]|nr:hypothetical protein NC652_013035 [Populus alba x Populus x berolinensis]